MIVFIGSTSEAQPIHLAKLALRLENKCNKYCLIEKKGKIAGIANLRRDKLKSYFYEAIFNKRTLHIFYFCVL